MSDQQPIDQQPNDTGSLGVAKWNYRNYTASLSPKQAKGVLIALIAAVAVGEISCRVLSKQPYRSTQNSMHGIREQLLELESSTKPKIVAVGDSSLVGSGVGNAHETTMGLLRDQMPSYTVANLGAPGGTMATALTTAIALQRRKIKGIQLSILEVLPVKFLSSGESDIDRRTIPSSAVELQRYIPDAQFAGGTEPSHLMPEPDYVESRLEYDLSAISYLYRAKDSLRINPVGSNPAFFFASTLMPKSIRTRMFGAKGGAGNNRLRSHIDDEPFHNQNREPSDQEVKFSEVGESEYFIRALQTLQGVTNGKVIVLEHPSHYEFQLLSKREAASYKIALADLDAFLTRVCKKQGALLVEVPSQDYQSESLWTRTPFHFNPKLHKIVFDRLMPAVREALGPQATN